MEISRDNRSFIVRGVRYMNNIDLMNYWIRSSDKDYDVMLDLKEKHRNTYALFFGQLLIEKLLKAYYAKINKKKEKNERRFIKYRNNKKIYRKKKNRLDKTLFKQVKPKKYTNI